MEQWLLFFLSGVIATAKKGKETFERIINLRMKYEQVVMTFGRRAKLSQKALVSMFSQPIVSIRQLSMKFNIAFNTADAIVQQFLKTGILKEINGSSRNRIFVLWEYLDLFKR